jgi:hypothetical protein
MPVTTYWRGRQRITHLKQRNEHARGTSKRPQTPAESLERGSFIATRSALIISNLPATQRLFLHSAPALKPVLYNWGAAPMPNRNNRPIFGIEICFGVEICGTVTAGIEKPAII